MKCGIVMCVFMLPLALLVAVFNINQLHSLLFISMISFDGIDALPTLWLAAELVTRAACLDSIDCPLDNRPQAVRKPESLLFYQCNTLRRERSNESFLGFWFVNAKVVWIALEAQKADASSVSSPRINLVVHSLAWCDIFSIRRWLQLGASKLLFVGLFHSQFIKGPHSMWMK